MQSEAQAGARKFDMSLLRDTWTSFNEDKIPRLAGSIAYATLFSIAPLFIIVIAIVGAVLGATGTTHGHTAAEQAMIAQVRHGAGDQAANTVQQLVAASFNKPRQNIWAQIIGWITFVIGASGLFSSLQDGLNTIWRVEATKGGWKQMVRDRLASFSMIAVVGFLLLVSFGANAAATVIGTRFASALHFPGGALLLNVASWTITFALATVIFALLYKVLPDVKIGWGDVWQGALVTAALFLIGQAAIALYISLAGVASAYGAAGSLLVALIWIYYSAMILLLGAELTKVRAANPKTVVESTLRRTVDKPAGVDPRTA